MRKMNIKQKSFFFPVMTVMAVLIVGVFSYFGFRQLNSSIGEVFGNLNKHRDFSSVEKDLVAIQGNTFKLIAWTVSNYPQDKVQKLAQETLRSLSKLDDAIRKNVGSAAAGNEKESFERILTAFNHYHKKVAETIDMVSVDSGAASSYMGRSTSSSTSSAKRWKDGMNNWSNEAANCISPLKTATCRPLKNSLAPCLVPDSWSFS